MEANPSTKERPAHSHEAVPYGGYGGYGSGYGYGAYVPGAYAAQYWACAHGKGVNGNPPKGGYGKGHGKANGQYGKGQGGKLAIDHGGKQNAQPHAPGPNDLTNGGSDAGSSRSGNAWQRRQLSRDGANGTKGGGKASGEQASKGAHASPEVAATQAPSSAEVLIEKMDTVQALIASLKGRRDQFSTDTRAQLEAEMTNLRIQRTQMKSIPDQMVVLENLVEKRETILQQAEADAEVAMQDLAEAKSSLMVARQQLMAVQEAKAKKDADIALKEAELHSPSTKQTVQKMRDMAQLLPADKAKVLAECLGLLETLMGDAAVEVINVEMEDGGSHSTDGQVVLGTHGTSASPLSSTVTNGTVQNVQTDPYAVAVAPPSATQGVPLTPRRGIRRTRSESPQRSPGARSRSNSFHKRMTGKQVGINKNYVPLFDAFVGNSFSSQERIVPFTG